MKVATYYNNKDIRIEERPVPSISEGEVLIKVCATSICGSDTMEWYRAGKGPRVLGHEIGGEIVKVGPGVEDYKKGDRVSASHHVPCYECHYCRLGHHTLCETLRNTNFDPGGFAELIRLPKINSRLGVYKLPANVSFEEATIIEPLACVVRAQKKVNVRKGHTVMVIGCGTSGLLHTMLAKVRGTDKVVACELSDFRLEAARRFGADDVFLASDDISKKLSEINGGRLADVVIVCAQTRDATLQSFKCVERGGTILFFAIQSPDQVIPLQMNKTFWEKGLTLMNSYAASPEDHREALELISTGRIKVSGLITHTLGLSEIGKGFELAVRADKSIKVLIDPTS